MGFLDAISPFLTQASNARSSYVQGQQQGQDKALQQALSALAQKRQLEQDQLKAALTQSEIGKNNATSASLGRKEDDIQGVHVAQDGSMWTVHKDGTISPARQRGIPPTAPSPPTSEPTEPLVGPPTVDEQQGPPQSVTPQKPTLQQQLPKFGPKEKPTGPLVGSPEWQAAERFKASLRPKPQDSFSPLVTTGPDGKQVVTPFNTRTGAVSSAVADAKAGAGGAGGERAGQAAAFLSRLKMGKADFDNGMQFIRDYHQQLSKDNTISPLKMGESAASSIQPNPEAHGLMGMLNNSMGAAASGVANKSLAKTDPTYQRYVNLLNSMSLAMTEVLPRPTQQILGIEKGINTVKAGDPPERIADIQHRLDKAYEYLFSDPEAMLRKGGAPAGGRAGGSGAKAPASSGNIDLNAKPPLADRVNQLKTQGLSKEAARAQLIHEGYNLSTPE